MVPTIFIIKVFAYISSFSHFSGCSYWRSSHSKIQKAIEWAIQLLIGLGVSWYLLEESEDERFVKIEFEWGYWIYDKEMKEYIEGEMWKDGVHQVWVHVPGEGDCGGHWEDDLDEDGVAASVDDDDTNPEVGDENPDEP